MAASEINMNQDLAQTLFREGATLVFLDVPMATEFGIDYNSWEVGPKFKGVKMIPPGVHFVYYSAVGKDRQVAPRTGFFHNFQKREVLVKKWDAKLEDISEHPLCAEEQNNIEANKEQLDKHLGVYPYDSYKKWVSLTNHLGSDLLARLQPHNRRICSVTELQSIGSTTQSRQTATANHQAATGQLTSRGAEVPIEEGETASANQRPDKAAEDQLPEMTPVPESVIHFTEIPKQTYPEGATPAEVTKYSMDHSYALEELLQKSCKGGQMDILGEIQFSFICFLIGQVYDGFEQWKKLVNLLCSCEEAMQKRTQLYMQFISMLHYHVREIPEDFFVDIVSRDNFLVRTLHTFFENLLSSDADASLKSRGLSFQSHLQKKFQWDFGDELDEDAPVVVEVD